MQQKLSNCEVIIILYNVFVEIHKTRKQKVFEITVTKKNVFSRRDNFWLYFLRLVITHEGNQ